MPLKTTGAHDRAKWCPRCRDREIADALDPQQPLHNTRYETFARKVAIEKQTNSQAYKSAGFKTKNVSTAASAGAALRRRMDVTNRITALLEREIERDLKTREWVDDKLKENVDRCMKRIPVTDERGQKLGVWRYDARNAITALQLMGKDRGMFVEKLEITGIEAELQGKSAEQIIEMVEAVAIDLGRDFVRRLGEKVGILVPAEEGQHGTNAGGDAAVGTPAATVKPVSTLQ